MAKNLQPRIRIEHGGVEHKTVAQSKHANPRPQPTPRDTVTLKGHEAAETSPPTPPTPPTPPAHHVKHASGCHVATEPAHHEHACHVAESARRTRHRSSRAGRTKVPYGAQNRWGCTTLAGAPSRAWHSSRSCRAGRAVGPSRATAHASACARKRSRGRPKSSCMNTRFQ
jgi:hypothetical protein